MLTSLHLLFQKEYVRLIQGSGVLVVLSQAWIEELYYQVLEHNLLGEAGYWGSPEDQTVPLITMLTGNGTAHEWLKSQRNLDYQQLGFELQVCTVRKVLLASVRYRRPGEQWDWRSADRQGTQPINSQL